MEDTFTLDEMMAPSAQSQETLTLDEMNNPLYSNQDAVNLEKRHGTWDAVQGFFGESVVKPVARAVGKVPAAAENLYRVGLDVIRDQIRNNLIKDGAVFGRPEDEFLSRTPEQQRRIDSNNKIMESMNRADEVSKRLSENWINLSETGWEARDPKVWSGSFMENPSLVRAIGMGFESAPMLGLAATVTLATKNPTAGASILGVIQSSDQYLEMREQDFSVPESVAMFGVNVAVLTAIEKLPMEGFLKGGTIGKRVVRGFVQEGLVEEPTQQIWSNAVEKLGWNESKSLFDGLVESIIAGGLSGGVIGAAMPSNIPKIEAAIKNAEEKGVAVDPLAESIRVAIEDNIEVIKDEVALSLKNPERTVSVNVTPEMQGAVDSGLPAMNIQSAPEAAKTSETPKMIEKDFVEEYEEPAISLEDFYKREYDAATQSMSKMLKSNPEQAGKNAKGRGFERAATIRQYRGEPTATEIKNEIAKLKRSTVGKKVTTPDGDGVISKNPSYGRVQVTVNGAKKTYLLGDISQPEATREDAIASLKSKAEKEMLTFLKSRGMEYSSTPVKKTRTVKRMVPAEESPKPLVVEEKVPLSVIEEEKQKTDDQILAEQLDNYVGGIEENMGAPIRDDVGNIVDKVRSSNPTWYQELELSDAKFQPIIKNILSGKKLTKIQQKLWDNIKASISESEKQMHIDYGRQQERIRLKAERLMRSGATEEEAYAMAEDQEQADIMDEANIVSDEQWLAEEPTVEPASTQDVLATPELPLKVTKGAKDLSKSMAEQGFEMMDDVDKAKYSPIEKKSKIEETANLMSSDMAKARRIAFGEEASGAADANIIYNAVLTKAIEDGDMDTQIKLLSSPVLTAVSKTAQALAAKGFNSPLKSANSVEAMADIENTRKNEVEKKHGKKVVHSEKESIKKQIKENVESSVKNISREKWADFIKSLECS